MKSWFLDQNSNHQEANMAKKVVIIGGVAAGASAAARLRRLDENAQIIMVERGEYISFANCGLPYYVGGVIKKRERLLIQTPRSMFKRFNIDVRNLSEVEQIKPQDKEIIIRNLADGEVYSESYDYLIMSPGASPIIPNIPGVQQANVFTVRNVPDSDRIKQYIDVAEPQIGRAHV